MKVEPWALFLAYFLFAALAIAAAFLAFRWAQKILTNTACPSLAQRLAQPYVALRLYAFAVYLGRWILRSTASVKKTMRCGHQME